eukprot:scaffold246468_cov40-Tisochrysis_lutea.AAC.3
MRSTRPCLADIHIHHCAVGASQLAAHLKPEIFVLYSFNIEPNRGHSRHHLAHLQLVQNSGLACGAARREAGNPGGCAMRR